MGCGSSKPEPIDYGSKFLEACEQGDLRTVHNLLTGVGIGDENATQRPFISVQLQESKFPYQDGFHKAAANGHLAVIRRFLAEAPPECCDINARDGLGMTALAWACVAGEDRTVDKLLRTPGIDPNIVDSEGSTALMLALTAPLWRALFEAEISMQGIISAVTRIRAMSNEEQAQEYGRKMAEKGWTPSQAAQYARNKYGSLYCGIAKELLRGKPGVCRRAKSSIVNANGASALSNATALGHTTAVLLLISGTSCDVNETCPKTGVTPLMRSSGLGHTDLVEILLANGSLPNIYSHSKMTALMWAADGGHLDIVETLIRRGANVNQVSNDGYTSLLLAIARTTTDHAAIAKLLLSSTTTGKADPNLGQFQGQSALHVAIATNQPELVDILVAQGAVLNKLNAGGDTPLLMAIQLGRPSAIDTLLGKDGDELGLEVVNALGWTALAAAAYKGDAPVVNKLLLAGAFADQCTQSGDTPLIIAAKQGHADVILELVQTSGADVNFRTITGSTPLILACSSKQFSSVTALLNCGADATLRNHYGNTALIVALSVQSADIADVLLDSGRDCSINAEGQNQTVALDYAQALANYADRERITRKLLALGATPRVVVQQVQFQQPSPKTSYSANWNTLHTNESADQEHYPATQQRRSLGGGGGGRSFAKTAWGVFRVIHTGVEIGLTIAELLGGL